jgi:DNA-binding protein H-NS
MNHVPEERIDLLRQYADQVNSMINDKEQQEQLAQQQAQQAQQSLQQQAPGIQAPGIQNLPPELIQQLLPNSGQQLLG